MVNSKKRVPKNKKKIFNALINGIITDYKFGGTVLTATRVGRNVTGGDIITTWESSSEGNEEEGEENYI